MAETVKTRIEELVGDDARVIDGDFERELYSTDMAEVPFAKRLFDTIPELVIMPKSVAALKKIVQFANDDKVAVFPRGSASSGPRLPPHSNASSQKVRDCSYYHRT